MRVTVRLFAVLRERAGRDSLEIEPPGGPRPRRRFAPPRRDAGSRAADRPRLGADGGQPRVRRGRREYRPRRRAGADPADLRRRADETSVLCNPEGDKRQRVAMRTRARVTDESLNVEELSRWVGDPGAGAIVTFQGVTREVASLDYEAYREMAEERITAILVDCAERHGLLAATA